MPHIDSPDDSNKPAVGRKRQRPELTPAQRALALLVRREHSRKELNRKLAARGIASEEAEAAVETMAANGWQNDDRFAELLVRSRANSGYGPLRIRAELGTHDLDRYAVAAAIEAYDGDWAANARELTRRRYSGKCADDRAIQRKAAEFLIRRGFAADHVRAAIRFDSDDS